MKNGCILLLSCEANRSRRTRINDWWRKNCKLDSYWIIGDPSISSEFEMDKEQEEIKVKCEDGYDWLPHKVHLGIKALSQFDYDFILKVDDDVIINNDRLHDWLITIQEKQDYMGITQVCKEQWGVYDSPKFKREKNKGRFFARFAHYCAGPTYFLSKQAYSIVCEKMDPEYIKLEDISVGTTLTESNIIAVYAPLYTDSFQQYEDTNSKFIAYHDAHRIKFKN